MTVTQVGDGNVACVQNILQQNFTDKAPVIAQASQDGDNNSINNFENFNAQAAANEYDIAVEQVNTIINKCLRTTPRQASCPVPTWCRS